LPRRSRRGDDLVNAQARQPSLNPITIYAIAVSQQILPEPYRKETLELRGPNYGDSIRSNYGDSISNSKTT
jgi:hypothetical protein